MSCKADDAGGTAPVKEENAAGRKIDRKDGAGFRFVDYILRKVFFSLATA